MTESVIGRKLPIVADRPALEVASRAIVRPAPRNAGIGATGILLDGSHRLLPRADLIGSMPH